MDKLYMSREGLEKLKQEHVDQKSQTRVVAKALEFALGLGDLRENADYHAAKEEQAMLAARIRDTEDKLSRAVIMDEGAMDADTAYIGATVKVRNKKTQRECVYVLVSLVEADIATGRISSRSPVGAALLGKAVGDVAIAKIPAGDLELEILEISR
jgi:transcription elongation factor GreA